MTSLGCLASPCRGGRYLRLRRQCLSLRNPVQHRLQAQGRNGSRVQQHEPVANSVLEAQNYADRFASGTGQKRDVPDWEGLLPDRHVVVKRMEVLNEEVVQQVVALAEAEEALRSCTGMDRDVGINTQRDAMGSRDLGILLRFLREGKREMQEDPVQPAGEGQVLGVWQGP